MSGWGKGGRPGEGQPGRQGLADQEKEATPSRRGLQPGSGQILPGAEPGRRPLVEPLCRGEGSRGMQEPEAGGTYWQERRVGKGGISLTSLVFVPRPCALQAPLNSQIGGCPSPLLEKRVEAQRGKVTCQGHPAQKLEWHLHPIYLAPHSHGTPGCLPGSAG